MQPSAAQAIINAVVDGADKVKLEGLLKDSKNRHRDTMSNWQRHQWAKAGYPPAEAGKFARMVRPHDR